MSRLSKFFCPYKIEPRYFQVPLTGVSLKERQIGLQNLLQVVGEPMLEQLLPPAAGTSHSHLSHVSVVLALHPSYDLACNKRNMLFMTSLTYGTLKIRS